MLLVRCAMWSVTMGVEAGRQMGAVPCARHVDGKCQLVEGTWMQREAPSPDHA